jgi:hypothetical protein
LHIARPLLKSWGNRETYAGSPWGVHGQTMWQARPRRPWLWSPIIVLITRFSNDAVALHLAQAGNFQGTDNSPPGHYQSQKPKNPQSSRASAASVILSASIPRATARWQGAGWRCAIHRSQGMCRWHCRLSSSWRVYRPERQNLQGQGAKHSGGAASLGPNDGNVLDGEERMKTDCPAPGDERFVPSRDSSLARAQTLSLTGKPAPPP